MMLGKLRMGDRRVVAAVVAATSLGLAAGLPAVLESASGAALASGSRVTSGPRPATGPQVTLVQITHDQGVDAGEGWLGTDPVTGKLVLDWLATSDASSSAGGDPKDASPLNVTRGYCGLAAENTAGNPASWSTKQLPFVEETQRIGEPIAVGPTPGPKTGNRNFPICGDPVLGMGPDGTVYAAAAMIGSPTVEQGLASLHNADGWSFQGPTEIFGPEQDLAGGTAYGSQAGRFPIGPGRAYMAVDQNTGAVAVISQEDGGVEGRWLVVSTNHGSTWSTPRPLDPNVQSSTAGAETAAHGVVAVAYVNDQSSATYMTSSSPAVKCPAGETSCTVFETTPETDPTNTWSRHVMPGPAASSAFPSTYVAGDSTHVGHFAVLEATSSGFAVWETTNSGSTWQLAKTFEAPSGDMLIKPAITYSPSGWLGVVYRVEYPSTSFDVQAWVSNPKGAWSGPITLTTDGPTAPNTGMSDDCACNIDMDSTHFSVVWGDDRQGPKLAVGNRQLWFATFDYLEVPTGGHQ